MTLADVREWLRTYGLAERYYIGRLDNRQEKALGVYDRGEKARPVMALGGAERTSYGVKRVSLLLHWNRNAAETEAAARALWQAAAWAAGIQAPGGPWIQFVQPAVPAPVSVGTDEDGVYEYVIDLNIYFRR